MSKSAGARRAALEERIRLAEQDLADLAVQIEDGELDEDDATGLEERYQADLADARKAMTAMPKRDKAPAVESKPAEPAGAAGRSGMKVLAIGAAAMVVLTVGIVVIAQGGGDEAPAAAPTSVPVTDSLADLVAAVEAQPGNNQMRLALADSYFAAGEYMEAMNHYSTITASDPTPEQASIANARIGWMAYSALNDPDMALQFLDTSISQDPLYGEAKLWKGVVLLYGMDDGPAAAPYFEEVLQMSDLPAELRPEVELMLEEATGGGR